MKKRIARLQAKKKLEESKAEQAQAVKGEMLAETAGMADLVGEKNQDLEDEANRVVQKKVEPSKKNTPEEREVRARSGPKRDFKGRDEEDNRRK